MELNNVDLSQLNQILNKTVSEYTKHDFVKARWGAREFILTDTDGSTTTVKMKDLVKRFQELAAGSNDEGLIKEISENIIAMDLIGDYELKKHGIFSTLARDLWRGSFQNSHLKVIDKIREQTLFKGKISQDLKTFEITFISRLRGLINRDGSIDHNSLDYMLQYRGELSEEVKNCLWHLVTQKEYSKDLSFFFNAMKGKKLSPDTQTFVDSLYNDYTMRHEREKIIEGKDNNWPDLKMLKKSARGLIYVKRAVDEYESGKIDSEQLHKLLNAGNRSGNTPMHFKENIELIMPIFKKMGPDDDLDMFLSITNINGQTPLHDSECLEALLPVLGKIERDDLIALLSRQDSKNKTPLHNEKNLELLFPFFIENDIKFTDLIKLFSIRDNDGLLPLNYSPQFVLPFFENLSTEAPNFPIKAENFKELMPLLTMRNEKGSTFIHQTDNLKKLLPFLKLPGIDYHQLFSGKDTHGKTPLHYVENLEIFLPVLESLDSYTGKTLLNTMKDEANQTLLHQPETLKLLLPFIEKQKDYLNYDIFYAGDIRGNSPLFNPENFKILLPVLKKMNFDEVIGYLKLKKNDKGEIALHDPQTLQLILPFLQENKFDLYELVSFTDWNGDHLFLHANCLEVLLPYFKDQTPENLIEILSVKNNGNSIFSILPSAFDILFPILEKQKLSDLIPLMINKSRFYGHEFDTKMIQHFLPLFEKQTNDNLVQLISSLKNGIGGTLLHEPHTIKLLLPIIESRKEILYSLLSNLSDYGNTPLLDSRNLKVLMPILEKVKFTDLIDLLSLKNQTGIFAFFLPENIKILLPLFENQKFTDLIPLLTMKTTYGGKTVFHDTELIKELMPFLRRQTFSDLEKVFSIENDEGYTPLHYPEIIDLIQPLLQKATPEQLTALFSRKDKNGNTPLHLSFGNLWRHLKELDPDQINLLFSIQNNQGNTILHDPSIWGFLHKTPESNFFTEFFGISKSMLILDKLSPDVFLIKNNIGLTPREANRILVSQNWLLKDKYTATESISEEVYSEKVQKLKSDVDKMWNSFVFGNQEGQIPEEYLSMKVDWALKSFKPEIIKENLDAMLDTIAKKQAWLGTPSEDNKESLHQFYSQMLMNFAQTVTSLEGKEPTEQAGTLIGLAKVKIEGRCAAAYQSEIEQAKMVSDSNLKVLGLDAAYQKIANNCLIGLIENLVRKKYHSDSHAFNQMLYSVGLAPNPDPLSSITIEASQSKILKMWEKDTILESFGEAVKQLDKEMVQFWFYERTPPEFKSDIVEKQAITKQKEQQIFEEVRKLLKSNLSEGLIDKALAFFRSAKGGELRVGSAPQNKDLSERVFKKLINATTTTDIQEALTIFNEDSEKDKSRRLELQRIVDDASAAGKEIPLEVKRERNDLQQKLIRVQRELTAAKTYGQARIGIMEEFGKNLSEKDYKVILDAKKHFDKAISDLADEEEIDFSAAESGLPSRALEHTRRLAYADQYKDNDAGATQILLATGVFEEY